MIPLRDENPTRSTPIVTVGLIVANVAMFFYQISIGLDLSAFALGLIPAELASNPNNIYQGSRLGLLPGQAVQNFDPAWATIFTSMFMHANWLHILGNMWFLWIFGNNIEDTLGHGRFLLFYLLSGIGAAFSQVLIGSDSLIPMVGASGAVAGVLGAYLVLFPGSRVLCLITMFIITTIELPASLVLGYWFLVQVISGIGAFGLHQRGGVAFAAHVGGFIIGCLLIRLLAPPRRPYSRRAPPPDFMDWR